MAVSTEEKIFSNGIKAFKDLRAVEEGAVREEGTDARCEEGIGMV